jgi:hypothetical protein
MLSRLRSYFFPGPLARRDELRRFVSGEASYVAQRSTYEFARNTLAWFGQSAFGDKKFNEVFAVCRWEAFAAIAADMTSLTRAVLAAPALDGGLLRLYSEALGEYPHPVHRPEGWSDRIEALAGRFRDTAAGQPLRPVDLAPATAARIYAEAPARSANVEEDRRVLTAAVSFGLVSFDDRMRRRLDREAIGKALAGDPAA